MKTRTVADGEFRLRTCPEFQARLRKLKESVHARYADQMAKASFWERMRLRRLIAGEISRKRLDFEPLRYALYFNGVSASGRKKISASIMRKTIPVLLLLMTLTFAGCKQAKEGANYQGVADDDAAMNAAIAKAKATSADFVAAFHAQKAGTHEFSVKKPYPTPSGSQEHMWIAVTDENNGVLKGIVANEAEETRAVTNGQPVTLNISEISDWKYIDGRKLVGGYTIRYFLERASAKEREEIMKNGGFEL